MKTFKLFLLAASFIFTTTSFAQSGVMGTRPTLSIGAEVAVPIADLKATTNFGAGGSLKFAFPLFDGGDVTVSGGYMSFTGKDINAALKYKNLNLIPLKAGLRFRLANQVYAEPQLGYTSLKRSGDNNSIGAFTYAANLGFMLSRSVDLSVRYENASKTNDVTKQTLNYSHIGARLAYNFKL